MKTIIALAALLLGTFAVHAQTRADIFNDSREITWLGLDFSHVKFIGPAAQWQDAGAITNAELKEKYFPAWNQLFIAEPKKYDVAGAVHRTDVRYAIEVTEKANNALKNKDFFSDNPDEYQSLDEQKIAALVKKYDFGGKSGIGLLFFVEGMSKAKEEGSAWVAFVDMKSRAVLLTVRETGKSGGFGFRNYWAKSFANMLKGMKSDYSTWKKKN